MICAFQNEHEKMLRFALYNVNKKTFVELTGKVLHNSIVSVGRHSQNSYEKLAFHNDREKKYIEVNRKALHSKLIVRRRSRNPYSRIYVQFLNVYASLQKPQSSAETVVSCTNIFLGASKTYIKTTLHHPQNRITLNRTFAPNTATMHHKTLQSPHTCLESTSCYLKLAKIHFYTTPNPPAP